MKKIGRGWQYTVYDIGNNRIKKIFNSKIQVYSVFLRECFPYVSDPFWKWNQSHKSLRDKAEKSLSWIRNAKLDPSLFGNPTILNTTDYEQDLVIPLGEYLESISIEKGKIIIDEFVIFNKFLENNGVIDKSFLIGKNYGINKEGKVILIDIGELFTEKEMIKNQIQLQPWDHPYVINTIPKPLRNYFVEQMNKNFTG